MKDTERAYLAGIIDADGSITISHWKNKKTGYDVFRPDISITGDLYLMEWLNSKVEKRRLYTKWIDETTQTPYCFTWRVSSRTQVENVLGNVLPFLITKKHEAETVLEYFKVCHSRRWMKTDRIHFIDRLREYKNNRREIKWERKKNLSVGVV